MATDSQSRPSFSPYLKWGIGLHVVLLILVVFAVVAMVNYLSRDYFLRFQLSARTRIELSPRTVSLLRSLTNQVKVTLYYDTDDELYQTVADLLGEYRLVNPKITITTVDYVRDLGAAQKVKAKYNLFGPTDKDVVIFDCEEKVKVVSGKALAEYVLEQVPNDTEREFRRKPTAFMGETAFTMALLDVTSPPLRAYFLQGHGEHRIDSGDELDGYLKFALVLQQNHVQVEPLSLLGTNIVPMDCNLLVIAGPREAIPDLELNKIEQYLNQGGRLLALFNCYPILAPVKRDTGLEGVLAKWGVEVGNNVIKDPVNTISREDIVVVSFGKHPLVNSLLGSKLDMILPRSVGQLKLRSQAADAPRVEELAFSGPKSYAAGDFVHTRPFPLMVAVEKGAIKDVITERGSTRMVVTGDSIFLANHYIDSGANRDFLGYAVNWLLERTQLLEGLGPRPVEEHRIVMTKAQLHQAQWVLLAGLPGCVLVLGGLVWLRRRN
jgi:gliding motility-associatede transport system auxiliary component